MQHVRVLSEYTSALSRHMELQTEGWLGMEWDLTVPCATMVVPMIVGFSFLASIELNANKVSKDLLTQGGMKKPPLSYTVINNAFRGFALMMIPVSASVPACVALYWAMSGMSGLCVNFVILSPRLRRLVRIPKLPQDKENPYRNVYRNFKSNWKDNYFWIRRKLLNQSS